MVKTNKYNNMATHTMTKSVVGKHITTEVENFLATKGFTEVDDQGRYLTIHNPTYADDYFTEASFTFYKGTLGCNSDPWILAGPGYSNWEPPTVEDFGQDFEKITKEVEQFLENLIKTLS